MIKYWDPRSVVQTVRPLVCSSNSATPGLQFKQWDPRSGAQILRTKVCGSNTESPGLHFMSCRPGLSVFKPQTWVLSIQAPDLACHCLNFRPGVSLFELQTWGLTVWTSDLGSQYLITDLRHQYQTHPTLKSSLVGRGRSPKKTPKPSCQVMSVVAKGLRKEFFRWYSTERPEPTEAILICTLFLTEKVDCLKLSHYRLWEYPNLDYPHSTCPNLDYPHSDKLPFKLTLGPLCLCQCF